MSEGNLEKQIIDAIHKSVSFLYPKEDCSFSNCKERDFSCCKNDIYLLDKDVHEQSITGKIHHYIENNIEKLICKNNLSVDIEFNKSVSTKNNEKEINCQNNENCVLRKTHCKGDSYRPDIIIHSRGTDNNILIIECKKAQTIKGKKVKNDFDKLKAFTCNNGNFKYKIGVSIVFNKEYPIFTYFLNKKSLEKEKLTHIINLLKEQNRKPCKIYVYCNNSETIEKHYYKDYRKKYIKSIDKVQIEQYIFKE